MDTYKHNVGETITFDLVIYAGRANGATGQSPTVAVKRYSDGFFLQVDETSWASGIANVPMTEYDSANMAGLYVYEFDQNAIPEQYHIKYVNTGPRAGLFYENHSFAYINASGFPTAEEIRIEMDDNSTQLSGIRTQTDEMQFTVGDIHATLDGEKVDIGAVNGVAVTNVDDFKADVSALATEANATANKNEILDEIAASGSQLESQILTRATRDDVKVYTNRT